MPTSTVLVTGVPGWLGNRLVARLQSEGRRVRCLVQPGQPRDALPDEVEVVRGDVRSADAVAQAVRGVDTVFHCAGIVHARPFREYRDVHVGGTRHLLDASARAGVRRFLFVSSEAAQGYNPGSAPLTEDDPCRPETEYGRTKRAAEEATLAANRAGGLETVVIRPAMFYGPGQPERRNRLMRMIDSGRPPLFGDGRNRRSMVCVESVVDALMLASRSDAAPGEVFWIADPDPYTTIGFFETVADALGVPLRPRYLPAFLATLCRIASKTLERAHLHSLDLHVVGESPRDFHCSVAKARERLGFEPTVTLADGVARAVEAFRIAEGSASRSRN